MKPRFKNGDFVIVKQGYLQGKCLKIVECADMFYNAEATDGVRYIVYDYEIDLIGQNQHEITAQKAKRFNTGKLRYDLLPSHPLAMITDVYTKGAHKYTVYEDEEGKRVEGKDIPFEELKNRKLKVIEAGDDNWRLGQEWLGVAASAKRHIESFMAGEDFDELGTYHIANAAWGMMTLLEFYKTHPELDNRKHKYLQVKKIGLDIDEVLADFVGEMKSHFPILAHTPEFWHDFTLGELFDQIKDDGNFWIKIKPKIHPSELPFEPHCYITSRTIDTQVTVDWLRLNGFPDRPVYTVGHNMSKVEAAKQSGIDIFVDDRYENFVELNAAGICTYLFDAPHNRRYNVGYKRIKSLNELL